ncbi:MAG TPA: phosphodiesterase, partial [Aliiroseovarius sp.]|nr:phosphodiesterase [Aliiroseovarius sp.]
MTALYPDFLRLPIAHRALHDLTDGRPENSLSAIRAAIQAGYGIEIDLQPSADGVPMVFHDYTLDRLTGAKGPISQRTAAELGQIPLAGSSHGDTIPTLAEVLDLVAGQVPLLIEIKDRDGALGPDVGTLSREAAEVLAAYTGPVAVMSFTPHAIAAFTPHAPGVRVGLTTGRFLPENWPVPQARLDELRAIPDFTPLGASFVSHHADALDAPRVAELKA